MCYAKSLLGYSDEIEIYFTTFHSTSENFTESKTVKNLFISDVVESSESLIENYIFRHFHFLDNLKYLRKILVKLDSKKKNETTYFLYPANLALELVSLIYLQFIKSRRVIVEKNELQIGMINNFSLPTRFIHKVAHIIILPLLFAISLIQDLITIFYSGVIAISTRIDKFFSIFSSSVTLIPVLVDSSRFNFKRPENSDGIFRFCFAGNVTEKKDSILTIIEALNHLTSKNWEFNIYGPVNKSMQQRIKMLAQFYNFSDKIKLHQPLSGDLVPQTLTSNDLLLAPRQKNLQTNYGFSTKIGEYLASGTPLLATDVSDNKLYIEDSKNGFLIKNMTVLGLASKIEEIMSKGNLKEIGAKGKEVAVSKLDYSLFGEKLYYFIFNRELRG